MKKLLLTLLTIVPTVAFSQSFSRSKSETIQNIKNAGYTVKTLTNSDYAFSYTRFDEQGEATVYFKCDNGIVRQALFMCNPPTGAPLRQQDILRTMTRAEMQTVRAKYGSWSPDDNSIITLSSKYYQGEARYFMKVYNDGKGEFSITPLN